MKGGVIMDDYEKMHAKYIGCGLSLAGVIFMVLLAIITKLVELWT